MSGLHQRQLISAQICDHVDHLLVLKVILSCFRSQHSLARTSAGCRSRGHVLQARSSCGSLGLFHTSWVSPPTRLHAQPFPSVVTCHLEGKQNISPVFFDPFVLHLAPHRAVFPLIQRGVNGRSVAPPEKGVNFFFLCWVACEERGLSYQLCESLSGTLTAICFFTLQVLYPARAVFLWLILPIPPQESRPPPLLPILSFPPSPWSWTTFFLNLVFLCWSFREPHIWVALTHILVIKAASSSQCGSNPHWFHKLPLYLPAVADFYT